MYPEVKGETQNNILLTFGDLVSTFAINNYTRGKRICCGPLCVDTHDQQKGCEFRWIGNRDDIKKSDDGFHSQWWSMKRPQFCQRLGHILDNESPRRYASSSIAGKALRWKRVFLRMDQWSKTTSHVKRYSDTVQYGQMRSDRGSWFINEFFLKVAFFNIHDTSKGGNWSFRTVQQSSQVKSVDRQARWKPVHFWNTRRVVTWTNQKSKTKWKRRPRFRKGRPVKFRHTGMAARILRESRGW